MLEEQPALFDKAVTHEYYYTVTPDQHQSKLHLY